MRARLLVLLAAVGSFWSACQCGPMTSPCDGVKCVTPLTCNPKSGRCEDLTGSGGGGSASTGGSSGTGGSNGTGGAGGSTSTGGGTGGSGGGTMLVCTPACTSGQVCDGTSCKTCLANGTGCSAPTPACDTAGNGGLGRCVGCTTTSCAAPTPFCDQTQGVSGACVGCRNFLDCPTFGTTCDLATHTCVKEDAGGTGGGSGSGGGSGGGNMGPTITFDDAGSAARCLPFDGGPQKPCTTECPRGFVCIGGFCDLRGSSGDLQVTLRFPKSEDLDLHLVEPVDAGVCEIWYGNPNVDAGPPPIPLPFPIPMPASCGAYGWLDLDSNAACNLDNVNIENIIYPPNRPVHLGTYKVRVDYYQNCSATSAVPYEVEVRAGGTARYYCGSFNPNQADNGSAMSGRDITQFTIK